MTGQSGLRPRRSGEPGRPLHYVPAQGVPLRAGDGRAPLVLVGLHDVVLDGFQVRGGSRQAVWIERCSRVTLRGLDVRGSAGSGIQIRDSSQVRIERSTVADNGRVGVQELEGVTDAAYTGLVVTGNGRGTTRDGGDGLQINGDGSRLTDSTVARNGQHRLWSHGVYVTEAATGYVLARNRLLENSGAGLKLQGEGRADDNVVSGSRLGVYVGATRGAGVRVHANRVHGSLLHGVFLDRRATVRMTSNEVESSGATGVDALFVVPGARGRVLGNRVGAGGRAQPVWAAGTRPEDRLLLQLDSAAHDGTDP